MDIWEVLKRINLLIQGLRKWSFVMSVLAVGIWFRHIEYLDGELFVKLVVGTGTVFLGANGFEHFTNAVKSIAEKKLQK